MNLKKKFLLIFLSISTIPIIVITLFTYDRYTSLVKEQTSQAANSIFEKAVGEANDRIKELKNVAMVFNFYSENTDSIVDSLKIFREGGPPYTSYDILESNQHLAFMCRNFIFTYEYIRGVFVFTPTGPILGYGNNTDIAPNYNPASSEWYQKTLEQKGSLYVNGVQEKDFIVTTMSTPSISFSQAIYDVFSHEYLGMVFIDCSSDIFDLSQINTLPEIAMITIQDSNDNLLSTTADSLISEIDSSHAKTKTADLDLEGLTLTFTINYDALYDEFGVTRNVILAIALLCFFIFVVISIFLSHSVTKPIIHLSKKMSIGNSTQLVATDEYTNRTDEIGTLYNEYNKMVETMSTYIKKELQNKLITLDSQMKSLEAQINSHFLYNTLESINSIAEIEEVESICTMSLALGDMFRYSIKTKSELVAVEEELKHVKDYVSIQQIRFDNRFRLVLDLPFQLYSTKVLKLILQPLVENAFYHGLNYCRSGSYIKISGRTEDHYLLLTVSDDGIGMSQEQVRQLEKKLNEPAQFTELGQRNKQSIGIKNIHTRILLYYGEGYGLQIASRVGNGTAITIRLPLLNEE